MKSKLILIVGILFSSAAFSAQEIKKSDTHQYYKTGSVSISSFKGGFNDALVELKDKVVSKGGSYYTVISLSTPGDSSYWSGNAAIYEKK